LLENARFSLVYLLDECLDAVSFRMHVFCYHTVSVVLSQTRQISFCLSTSRIGEGLFFLFFRSYEIVCHRNGQLARSESVSLKPLIELSKISFHNWSFELV
jgi:hypothetical protein